MRELFERLRGVETLLWIVASVLALVAFFMLAPSLISFASPTATPVAVSTPRPTLTPINTATSVPLPPPPKAQALTPRPTSGAGGMTFTFVADPTQSGHIQSGEAKPLWGDRSLHAGMFKGRTFQSVLLFDLRVLPAGSKVLYAEILLTGLNRDNLGPAGTWTLRLLESDLLTGWAQRPASDFGKAPTLATIGGERTAEELGVGRINQFLFAPAQLSLLEQAIGNRGLAAFRLDGPMTGTDSLFTWDSGGLTLTAGAHPVLNLVVVPAQFTVVTNTPTPINVLTAAAYVQTATAFATRFGSPTPFPRSYATATPVIFVTEVPTPLNVETRVAIAQYATAVALTTGTFTPTPPNWIVVTPIAPTATPYPTWTPASIPLVALTPYRTPTPRLSAEQLMQTPIPTDLKGNIIFYSNRYQTNPQDKGLLLMSPAGVLGLALTGSDYYQLAFAREPYSPDRQRRAIVAPDAAGILQIWIRDFALNAQVKITNLNRGVAYDPAWSPDGNTIAYVSTETGGDDLYLYDVTTRQVRRLTDSTGLGLPFNKHPSWSPDSQQLVFWSSRTGQPQIFKVNVDGTGLTNLSRSTYDESDPIWVK